LRGLIMGKISHIVVLTIGSDGCKKAVDKGIKIAIKENCKITFIYIVDTSFLSGIPRRIHGVNRAEKDLNRIGRIILERAREKASKKEAKVATAIRTGNIMEELERFLKESKGDLLIISSEKRGFLDTHLSLASSKRLEEITGISVLEIE
tara:strand:+ start:5279 stop:5728 length:450 start_codon:yes stop_codon:yes gene_type:complete